MKGRNNAAEREGRLRRKAQLINGMMTSPGSNENDYQYQLKRSQAPLAHRRRGISPTEK
ncbi:hypothetical protein [Escherichia coli]|uniref:hypothetical protein n=1 Tax=Escherichia coli TaxID=562 RepID=UPI00227F514E|nr:hypothetical protein [Escherichia coli]